MATRIDLPPNVVASGYGKRFFAYLLDIVVIVLGIVSVYFLFSKNVMFQAVGYDATVSQKEEYIANSRLASGRKDNWGKLSFDVKVGEEYGHEIYAARVWYYATEFLPSRTELEFNMSDVTSSKTKAALPTFNGNRDNPQEVGKWAADTFFASTAYFAPVKDAQGNPDYSKRPVLTDYGKTVPASVLLVYWHNSNDGTGFYDDAYEHFFAQKYVNDFDTAIANKQWLAYIPAVVISPVLFNLLIPLLFPKGKTIGKLLLGLAVVDEEGFPAKKSRLLLRYAIITACYAMLIVQNYWIAIFGAQILMTLLFITVALSGTGQGIHDIFARTVVVDERKSVLFKNEEHRSAYLENHPDSEVAEWFREKTADEFMERYGDRMEDE